MMQFLFAALRVKYLFEKTSPKTLNFWVCVCVWGGGGGGGGGGVGGAGAKMIPYLFGY